MDLVLGQGRVAGQAILKDVGRAALQRTYDALVRSEAGQPLTASSRPLPWPVAASTAVLMLALFGIGLELRARWGRLAVSRGRSAGSDKT